MGTGQCYGKARQGKQAHGVQGGCEADEVISGHLPCRGRTGVLFCPRREGGKGEGGGGLAQSWA